MKLRVLMAIILSPLIVMCATLAYFDLRDLNGLIEDARQSKIATQEIESVGELVIHLQRERGLSTSYLASGGTAFRDGLDTQRSNTDRIRLGLEGSLSNLAQSQPQNMAQLRNNLAELTTFREAVDAGRATGPEVMEFYSAIVEAVHMLQSGVVNDMPVPELESLSRAALYVSHAQDTAGQERSAMAAGLSADTFPLENYRALWTLSAVQRANLYRAEDVIEERGFANGILASDAHAGAVAMRDAAHTAMGASQVVNIAPEQAFETSTNWVDYLSQVKNDLSQQAITEAVTIFETARTNRNRVVAVTAAVTLLAVGLAIFGFERVISRVKRLTLAMQRFTKGEFDVWIPGIKDRDEVGEMAAAVYTFKQETLAMRKAAEEKKADDEAIILGKAQRVVDLLTDGLAALAQADLTRHFDDALDAEYDSIRVDFNTATTRLREVTRAIAETAVDLNARAGELQQSSASLGERTTQQVNTIDATNARVGQLSQEVEAYAGNVSDAARLATSAKDTADRSGDVVRSAVEAMSRISSSSQEIGRIISMIEDISFQTNLLALNAGVEAARAGESGRGFAVVASEVRDLARRSSEATQEIKTLIDDSRRQVQDGVELVGEAGDALQAIFGEIVQVDETLGSVAEGAVRQADSLRTLADDIDRLNALASSNTEMADQTGRAADDTTAISHRLTELVGDFRLAKDSPVTGSRAVAHG